MCNKSPPKLARRYPPFKNTIPPPRKSISARSWPAPMFCGVYYHLINLLSLCYKLYVFSSILCYNHQEPAYLCPPLTIFGNLARRRCQSGNKPPLLP